MWDEKGLSKELRTDATEEIINIVYRYFDENIALAFYGEIWKQYVSRLIVIEKLHYQTPEDYIERSIYSYQKQIDDTDENNWNPWSTEKNTTLISLF